MNWYADFADAVRTDEPLAPLTWFGLGGPAKYYIEPRSVAQLQAIVVRLREREIPMLVLGAGANLLVRDEGVNAAVIRLSQPEFTHAQFNTASAGGPALTAGAGKNVQKLVLECTHAGLSGLECLAGIPGSVGGELKMNAGGTFGDIGGAVETATLMDTLGHVVTKGREELNFEYRKSRIPEKFILSATFRLQEEDPQRVLKKVKEIWMFKKNSQPLAEHSAGCIFKNPPGFSAGALIDRAGLKGAAIGGAEVSTKHANFIVAKHGAKAADVLALIELIRQKVLAEYNIQLETEVIIW